MSTTTSNPQPAASLNIVDRVYARVLPFIARYGLIFLRLSIGILFLWLGILKLFPGVSPAEPIMRAGMPSFLPMDYFIPFAGVWEVIIGLGFITGLFPRLILGMTIVTLCTTLSIFVLAPTLIWQQFPFLLTFEGQYVIKDIVIISSALALLATVRGGQLVEKRPEMSLVEMSAAGINRPSRLDLWKRRYSRLERRVVRWLARHSLRWVRIGIGIVFLWFGILNLLPESPAQRLFVEAIPGLRPEIIMPIVGLFDIAAGISFVLGRFTRLLVLWVVFLAGGTLLGFVARPALMFQTPPLVFTLEGQYVLKNLTVLAAGLVVLVPAGGGALTAVRPQ
jgi:uncharacterized membrane protein YkgB